MFPHEQQMMTEKNIQELIVVMNSMKLDTQLLSEVKNTKRFSMKSTRKLFGKEVIRKWGGYRSVYYGLNRCLRNKLLTNFL